MVRFRRKVRIGKGFHMNLSKSGVSFSMGIKGLSLTLGRRGAYINYGIPGTGLYNRRRIGGVTRTVSYRQPRYYTRPSLPKIPKSQVIKMPKIPVIKQEKITTNNVLLYYSFELDLHQDGTPVMTVYDRSGIEVHDEHIERLIKRNDRYKQQLSYIEQEKKNKTYELNCQFIEIYKQAERPITKEIVEYKLRELKPAVYTKTEFNTPKPTIEDVKQIIREEVIEQMEASKPIRERVEEDTIKEIKSRIKPYPTIESVREHVKTEAANLYPDGLFRNRSKQREDYINQNIDSRFESEKLEWKKLYNIATCNLEQLIEDKYNKYLDRWQNSLNEKIETEIRNNAESRLQEEIKKWEDYRDNFDVIEAEKEEAENILLYQEYEEEKSALEDMYYGPEDYVNARFDEALSSMELPVEIAVNYEYNEEKGLLSIDLDLPEIEDMPHEQADFDSKGHLVVKYKTDKDIYSDYEQCIYGLAFYLAGLSFNFTTRIYFIEISGYTQKTDILSGGTIDTYVYSVLFDRKNFRKLDFNMIDPIRAFNSFPHIVNKESNGELLAITIDKPLSETCKIEDYAEEPQSLVVPEGCIKLESNQENSAIYRFYDENAYFDDREYWKKDGVYYFVVNSAAWNKAIDEYKQYLKKEESSSKFVENNNKGIQLEKEGKIEEAIVLYEENIKIKVPGTHPYDRLMILYHKMGRYADELRVVKSAAAMFPREEKYSDRLVNLLLKYPELSTPVK